MRLKHRKAFISGVALTLAGVLGVGALLETSVSVQASSAMMPGIEQIVGEVSEEKPFRILEIVDDKADAEIGYYVSGQEPYIKLYEYQIKDENGNVINTIRFSSLEEGLSYLPTEQLRQEFATNVKYDENMNIIEAGTGIKDITDVAYKEGNPGNPMDYPLSYTEYEEKYFLDEGESTEDGWNQIDFVDEKGKARIDKVTLNGSYVEAPSGNGDYTKQEQSYYPIRIDTNDGQNTAAKFRENIQNFFYSEGDGASAPYHLEFAEVSNDTVNSVLGGTYEDQQNPILQEYDYAQGRYGYYENVYADLTTELAGNLSSFPGENPEAKEGKLIQTNENLAVTELFNSGDEELFGSLDTVSEEELFGVGDVGDEPDYGNDEDVFSDDVFTAEEVENNEPIENNQPAGDAAIPDVLTDGSGNNSSSKESVILGSILNVTTAGSQLNPYIYLGKSIAQYPNYEYTKVGDLEYVKKMAEDNKIADEQKTTKGETIVRKARDITFENDQYWYWEVIGENLVKQPLSIVTGRQPVDYNHIRAISEELDYNYYYRVEKAYFCCKLPDGENAENPQSFQYFGWYFPSYPQNEQVYLPIEAQDIGAREATHYISDAEYKLTPGIGNYDFVPGGDKPCAVEVNHAYYRGGYVNNDWLKRHVFHLSPTAQTENKGTTETDKTITEEDAKQQFDNFAIEVDTFTAVELENKIKGTLEEAPKETPILSVDESVEQDVSRDQDETQTEGEGEIVDKNQNESEGQIADENQNEVEGEIPGENQVHDENQLSDYQEETSDTNTDEVTAFGDGEVSQVEPMVSEVMEELVGPEADQIFSDGSDQNELEQTEEQEPDIDSLFNDPDTPDAEEVFSSEEAVNFTSGVEEKENNSGFQLSDYDLIYINSNTTSKDTAVTLAASKIPCIINQEKVLDSASIKEAFSDFLHNDDTDMHYVNQYVYFFRDLDETGKIPSANLVNLNFKTPFYSKNDISDGGSPAVLQGFEEIKDYIDSENQYRGLEAGIEPLSYDISQARAIEYILNYKLKRNVKLKDKINVLEIQPAYGNDTLSKYHVLDWLGAPSDIRISEYCCQQNAGNESIQNILDGNKETIWHSKYDQNHEHYFTVELPNSLKSVKGITYQPRPTAKNGIAKKIVISLYDKTMNDLGSYNASFNYKTYPELQKYDFENPIADVKYIKIAFQETIGNSTQEDNLYASCAEFDVEGDFEPRLDITDIPDIEITHMTASEFVGRIEDLNSNYDLIYIGDGSKNREQSVNGEGNLLYTHIGGVSLNSRTQIKGLMDADYGPFIFKDTQGQTISETRIKAGSSNLRGAGNDITLEKKEALLDFVKSGYPVLIGDNLMKKTNGVYQIDTSLVDTASYYYKFIDETKEYSNVMKLEEAEDNVSFYLELPKPEIMLTQQPPSVLGGNVDRLTEQELTYDFHIESEAEPSPESSRYHCALYIDLNNDGVYSNLEDQSYYIEIKEKDKGVVLPDANGRYRLKLDVEYVLTRRVPMDYYKLIPWKLQVENADDSYVRSSVIGYTKRSPEKKQEIKVLQIGATTYEPLQNDRVKENWNLSTSENFEALMGAQEDFDIKITYLDVNNFTDTYENSWQNVKEKKNYLDQFDMIIIGFRDVYDNIPNNPVKVGEELKPGPVDAILQFIEDGKSVIFSHDTTSFVNRDRTIYGDLDTDGKSIPSIAWDENRTRGLDDWGYSLNSKLRTTVGMDRYGIVSNKQFNGISVKDILKQGKSLPIVEKILSDDASGVSIADIDELVGDMAFAPNQGQEKTVAEVQGFTNLIVESTDSGTKVTKKVANVNKGAITMYPYEIPDSFQCAETHSQYYQLALEEDSNNDGVNDIVVWYCLAGSDWYNKYPNDVRNNYYFYSKGNVIYTGVGHSLVDMKENNIVPNEWEQKLFVNAIVAAASVTAVQPQVEFIKSFYPGSEREQYRYYMTDYHLMNNESGNILDNNQEFNFSVRDYNMVTASLDSNSSIGKMKVELYIENENGSVTDDKIGGGIKLSKITGIPLLEYNGNELPIEIKPGEDGVYELSRNGTYQFSMNNLEDYLWSSGYGYKNNVKIYVKVSNTVRIYGKDVQKVSVDSIVLKQRQLFDLD